MWLFLTAALPLLAVLPAAFVNCNKICCRRKGQKREATSTDSGAVGDQPPRKDRLETITYRESQQENKEQYYQYRPRELNMLMNGGGRGDRPRMFFDMNPDADARYMIVYKNQLEEERCYTTDFARLQWYPGQRLPDEKAPSQDTMTKSKRTLTVRKKVSCISRKS